MAGSVAIDEAEYLSGKGRCVKAQKVEYLDRGGIPSIPDSDGFG